MKKNLIIILVIIIIIVAGIFVFSSKSKQGEETTSPAQPAEELTPTQEPATTEEPETTQEPETTTEEPESSPSNSLSLSGSYRCTYTIENGMQVTTYVKNGKMRTEISLPDGDQNVSLYIDDKVYQWSDKEKEGMFMSVEEAEKQQGTEVQDPDKYLEEIKNKYKVDCKNADLADSLFRIPQDIEFQDLSQLLNQ